MTEHIRTDVERQFWRESEQRWVPIVNMITWGTNKDDTSVRRHRIITTTTDVGEWYDGEQVT